MCSRHVLRLGRCIGYLPHEARYLLVPRNVHRSASNGTVSRLRSFVQTEFHDSVSKLCGSLCVALFERLFVLEVSRNQQLPFDSSKHGRNTRCDIRIRWTCLSGHGARQVCCPVADSIPEVAKCPEILGAHHLGRRDVRSVTPRSRDRLPTARPTARWN